MLAPPPAPAPLGLTALLGYVRQALTQQLAEAYWVVAEVAEITLPRFAGAHCYLTLTEQTVDPRGTPLKAQARATLWSQRYQQLAPAFERQTGQPLRPGLKLLLRVQVRFHEQYGLSLDVVALDPSYTVGELTLLRLNTLRRLDEKGLLERRKQLALPLAPQRLAVIPSPTAHRQLAAAGAALHARTRQAAQGPRAWLRQLAQGLGRFRHQLPRAARQALAREQRGLRRRGRALAARFARHHRRRREALLRRRYQLQLALERHLHRQELRLARLGLKGEF